MLNIQKIIKNKKKRKNKWREYKNILDNLGRFCYDLYIKEVEVTVKVVIPKKINDKQKEALVDYVKAGGGNISPQEKNFFERLKDKLNGE